ncbi:VanW family protein [Candidatus Berkelbacteria bacterium]|nr:VanW family protein [Candidatus Berkelbacteria bacterium]
MVSKRGERRMPRWVVALGSGLLGFVVLVVGLYGFYQVSYRQSLYPNTVVAGLNLGGLSTEEAVTVLAAQTEAFQASSLEILVDGEPAPPFRPADLSIQYHLEATAEEAWSVGRRGTLWENVVQQLLSLVRENRVNLKVEYDAAALDAFLVLLGAKYDVPEQNAKIVLDDGVLTITEAVPGNRFDRAVVSLELVRALEQAAYRTTPLVVRRSTVMPSVTKAMLTAHEPKLRAMLRSPLELAVGDQVVTVEAEQLAAWLTTVRTELFSPITESGFPERVGGVLLGVDESLITTYLTTLSETTDQEPVDARLTIKDGKAAVFRASQDGRTLSVTEATGVITDALTSRLAAGSDQPHRVTLPVTVAKANVTSSTVDQLGIKELIGTATTDFTGSPSNRVHNITNGTKYLNGWLLKPGEEFSTVRALGAIDDTTGYLPELVIKENRTIPEYGGGLCQVSTTLFRAVLNAGLPVTERRQHSYRVSYYERDIGPGLDATIYLPKPDFKFTNDTPGWILVQGSVSGLKVTFEIYGTSDGRESSIDGPHTLSTTPAPEAVYEETDQLAVGEEKQVEKPHAGATTVATYTVRRGGEVIHQQTFQSKYKALPARYLRGTGGVAPASEAAPSGQAATTEFSTQAEEPVQTAPDPAP